MVLLKLLIRINCLIFAKPLNLDNFLLQSFSLNLKPDTRYLKPINLIYQNGDRAFDNRVKPDGIVHD